jgi:hypothetical protein
VLGRVRQVWYYLRPRLDGLERHVAVLNPAQRALFAAMSLPDRAHALRGAGRLDGAPAYVIEAALLHDCGKLPGYSLAGRILGVLLGRFVALPAAPEQTGLRRQLQIYQWHEAWGIAAAERAGTSAEALALMKLQEAPQPGWLERFKLADDLG